MGTIFKVFIEYVIILLPFYVFGGFFFLFLPERRVGLNPQPLHGKVKS